MAYCTYSDVQNELGRTLTSPQQAFATTLIAQAEDWINRYTHRSWGSATPIVDELHLLEARFIYTKVKPIASVQAVKVRSILVGAADTTLLLGTGYEVLSLTDGLISLSPGYDVVNGWYDDLDEGLWKGGYCKLSYTPTAAIPGAVVRAAVLLVADWLEPMLSTVPGNVKRYGVRTEFTVEYFSGAEVSARALGAMAIMKQLKRRVFA